MGSRPTSHWVSYSLTSNLGNLHKSGGLTAGYSPKLYVLTKSHEPDSRDPCQFRGLLLCQVSASDPVPGRDSWVQSTWRVPGPENQ